jgi:ribosomal protein S18 acetylase RimI-like enzyme
MSIILPQLRPASSADREFLYTLHVATMKDLIERTWGWDEEWQLRDFDRRIDLCQVSVIQVEDHAVGAIWVEVESTSIYVTELQILPSWQGRGIGTAVMKETIRHAVASGHVVDLAVLQLNARAKSLYERLGFEVTKIDKPFIYMRYRPSKSA